jgi:hypothetical protein
MTPLRLFGMVALLAGLGAAATLGTSQFGGNGRPVVTAQIDQALFTGADASLAVYRAGTGTFVGAPAPAGMRLVRAEAASYCIEAVQGTAVEHEQGPGGPVQPGPC